MFDLLKLACNTSKAGFCRRTLPVDSKTACRKSSCSDDDRFGVRVLYQGAWGFAASPTYTADEIGYAYCPGLGAGLA